MHTTPLTPDFTPKSFGQAQRLPVLRPDASPREPAVHRDETHENSLTVPSTSLLHIEDGEGDSTAIKSKRESAPAHQYPKESAILSRPPSGPAKLSIPLLPLDRGNLSADFAPSDLHEGAFISHHPQSGEEIVVFPGPRVRPPYERSIFVTG
jgi:hypothetical protein